MLRLLLNSVISRDNLHIKTQKTKFNTKARASIAGELPLNRFSNRPNIENGKLAKPDWKDIAGIYTA